MVEPVEVDRMLVLSTGHLTEYACETWLHDCPWVCYQKGEFGWFIYLPAGDPDPDEAPACVTACIRYARTRGCQWIMFDRDGPEMRDLPRFEW